MALKHLKIYSILEMTSKYLDKELLDKALELIPISVVWSNACESLREIQLNSSEFSLEESVLLEKLFLENFISWFKNDFFSWFDSPYCSRCDKYCEMVLNDTLSTESYVDNTEVYQCSKCQHISYFERYNDPYKLLKTRKGRCSEFSQVFTVMCFAIGYEARFIYDTNDHAWTEVYSHLQGRWIHCDPSEGVIDKPLMYELGWRKNPTLIMSFSPTKEIQDVTWRYSQDHKGVLSRREPETNDLLLSIVSKHNKQILENCSSLKRRYLFKRLIGELAEFLTEPKPTEVYSGRVSGSLEWREQRGEVEVPIFHTGYVFKLHLDEIKNHPNYYCMWYSANCDTYLFYCNKGSSHFQKGWKSCTYSCKNIMRKEELDWDQTYLAREVNGKSGMITWKFDVSNTDFYINGIFVKINAFHLDSGVIEFKAYNNKNKISCKNGTELNCSQLHPENTLTVEIILDGGSGEISWQQAQIARQSKNEGPTVSFGIVLNIDKKNV